MGSLLSSVKKLLSNRNTITILGVLLGVVVLYFGYTLRVKEAVNLQPIPYANQKIIAGTLITEDMISETYLPKKTMNKMKNLLTNRGNIVGKLVSYNSKIAPNSFFYSENVIAPNEAPKSIFSNIEDGYTIYELGVDNESTYGNSIFPDDSIDLYLSTKIEEQLSTSNTGVLFGQFIKSIKVLAVRTGNGKDVFIDKDNLGTPSSLLFSVPESMFVLLKRAEKYGSFKLHPVPRNASYSKNHTKTELVSEEIKSLIDLISYHANDDDQVEKSFN